jgi:hypothetical protein
MNVVSENNKNLFVDKELAQHMPRAVQTMIKI